MKLGPIMAMVLILLLGAWLVLLPTLREKWAREATGITTVSTEIETRPSPISPPALEYRIRAKGSSVERAWYPAADFPAELARFSDEVKQRKGSLILGFFNISSWGNFLWVVLGLAGQMCFFGRMLIQWVSSERERKSVIPPLFWLLSFIGGVMLFVYFVWRKDPVGVLGQSTGIVIYARNLRLIRKELRREQRRQAQAENASGSGTAPATPA